MSTQKNIFGWQETKGGLIFIVLFNLFMVYAFASVAANTDSMAGYAFALVFLVLAVAQGVKLYRMVAKT